MKKKKFKAVIGFEFTEKNIREIMNIPDDVLESKIEEAKFRKHKDEVDEDE